MKPEDRLQIAVMDYLRLQYPNVLAIHVANERATSPMSGALLKRKGVTAGVPDVLVFKEQVSSQGILLWNGLAIELKVGKNKPTPKQRDMIERFLGAGWAVYVCYSFEEAKNIIDIYLRGTF
jgi:hypothetical protein